MTISRRAALGGLMSISTMGAAAAQATPQLRTQKMISDEVHDRAVELSALLTDLDSGRWEVRVMPHFMGVANYKVQPVKLPPRLRTEIALGQARAALNDLQPGLWRSEIDENHKFAVIINDNPWGRAS